MIIHITGYPHMNLPVAEDKPPAGKFSLGRTVATPGALEGVQLMIRSLGGQRGGKEGERGRFHGSANVPGLQVLSLATLAATLL